MPNEYEECLGRQILISIDQDEKTVTIEGFICGKRGGSYIMVYLGKHRSDSNRFGIKDNEIRTCDVGPYGSAKAALTKSTKDLGLSYAEAIKFARQHPYADRTFTWAKHRPWDEDKHQGKTYNPYTGQWHWL